MTSSNIAVSVPTGDQAISNGSLVSTTSAPGWDTWRWRVSEPMAPYLAFFAAGRFDYESGVSKGLPYFNAVSQGLSADNRAKAMRLMRRSPGVIRWLETQLGAYPFSSTGGVTTSLAAGFALENQTRPTYPFLGNGRFGRDIVVHELAHQWFGDHVAVDRWRDIWLNEGFATWFEWRYAEAHGGRSAQRTLLARYGSFGDRDPIWHLRIGNPGAAHLFDFAVYERGGMALQALRNRIGNDDFRTLLRRWVDGRGGGTASGGRLDRARRRAEEVGQLAPSPVVPGARVRLGGLASDAAGLTASPGRLEFGHPIEDGAIQPGELLGGSWGSHRMQPARRAGTRE